MVPLQTSAGLICNKTIFCLKFIMCDLYVFGGMLSVVAYSLLKCRGGGP